MNAIPRTIHYCWFGGNPLGEKETACIDSWKKFFPDYDIVRWDESNFDVRCCDYVSEAYDAKKWAFVSDYARFKILYDNGGLYFDTDVEVIKDFGEILEQGPFMGFEIDFGADQGSGMIAAGLGLSANPGLGLSANPGLGLYKAILDSFEGDHFLSPDGSYDQTTIVTRVTELLCGLGLQEKPGIQKVAGVTIYPSEYFNPKDFTTGRIVVTENTYSIHHFSMSWYNPEQKFQHSVNEWLTTRGISGGVARRVSAVIASVRYLDFERVANYLRRRIDG